MFIVFQTRVKVQNKSFFRFLVYSIPKQTTFLHTRKKHRKKHSHLICHPSRLSNDHLAGGRGWGWGVAGRGWCGGSVVVILQQRVQQAIHVQLVFCLPVPWMALQVHNALLQGHAGLLHIPEKAVFHACHVHSPFAWIGLHVKLIQGPFQLAQRLLSLVAFSATILQFVIEMGQKPLKAVSELRTGAHNPVHGHLLLGNADQVLHFQECLSHLGHLASQLVTQPLLLSPR